MGMRIWHGGADELEQQIVGREEEILFYFFTLTEEEMSNGEKEREVRSREFGRKKK